MSFISKRLIHTARFEWIIDKDFTNYIVKVFRKYYSVDVQIHKHDAGTDIQLAAYSQDLLMEGVGAFYVHMTLYFTRSKDKGPEKESVPFVQEEEHICLAEQLFSQARYIFEHHQE